MVDGGDAVDAEADAEDDEGGLEVVGGGFLGGGGEEGVDVDVAVVGAGVDAEGGVGVFVCEGSEGFVSGMVVSYGGGETDLRQRAAALGPNHSPGCFPQACAPCSTKRWMLKGASGVSANSARRAR